MTFSFLTWLLISLFLTTTTSQFVGRYIHDAGDFRIVYNVNRENRVMLTFTVPGGQPFRSSELPLRGGPSRYTVDFRFRPFGVQRWYTPIRRRWPKADIQRGDLVTLDYEGIESFNATFQGQELRFVIETQSLIPAVYTYRAFKYGAHLQLSFFVEAAGEVIIRVGCGRGKTVRESFRLEKHEIPLPSLTTPFVLYSVNPAERVERFLRGLEHTCSGFKADADDLEAVIFASGGIVYSRLAG
ncbi:hypothetical protein FOZ62_004415, partial [Perkinsus olseni]